MSTDLVCRACGHPQLFAVLDAGPQPIAHRLLDRADAVEETFPFALHGCERCGFVQVADPISPQILYGGYNYNFSSWKHEAHMPREVDMIVASGAISSVIDIGCNDGAFLAEMRTRGGGLCVGIEPNPVPAEMARRRGFHIYAGMAHGDLADRIVAEHGFFDVVVSRQVLEHVLDLDAFFACISRLLRKDGRVLIDVPDNEGAMAAGDSSLLWEEHCNYFTEATLRHVMQRNGFAIDQVARFNFAGGTIAVLAQRSHRESTAGAAASANGAISAARRFGSRVSQFAARFRAALTRARAHGFAVVLYGVGVRACGLVNFQGLGDLFDFAIDDQAARQGKYMAGCRLPIRSPDALSAGAGPVLCVLAVSNEFEAHVMAKLRERTGRPIEFFTVCSPADIWRELERAESL